MMRKTRHKSVERTKQQEKIAQRGKGQTGASVASAQRRADERLEHIKAAAKLAWMESTTLKGMFSTFEDLERHALLVAQGRAQPPGQRAGAPFPDDVALRFWAMVATYR